MQAGGRSRGGGEKQAVDGNERGPGTGEPVPFGGETVCDRVAKGNGGAISLRTWARFGEGLAQVVPKSSQGVSPVAHAGGVPGEEWRR